MSAAVEARRGALTAEHRIVGTRPQDGCRKPSRATVGAAAGPLEPAPTPPLAFGVSPGRRMRSVTLVPMDGVQGLADRWAARAREIAAADTGLSAEQALLAAAAEDGAVTPAPATVVALTPRQVQVVELVGRGLSDDAIALRLHVGRAAVRSHITAVSDRLRSGSRSGMVGAAIRAGLLPLADPDPACLRLQAAEPEERELIHYVAAGQAGVRLGLTLGVRPSTAANRVKRLLHVYGARDRAELVVMAARAGIYPDASFGGDE